MALESFKHSFDEPITALLQGSDSLLVDELMTIISSSTLWIPFYLILFFLVLRNNESMKQISLLLGCGLFSLLCSNVPALLSDVSSNAANTMSLALFFVLLVRNWWLAIGLFSWSLVNGLARIYLGTHTPSDVVAGFLLGMLTALISYIVYRKIYKRITSIRRFVSTQYTSTGYALADVYIVLFVLLLSFVFAIIKSTIVNY